MKNFRFGCNHEPVDLRDGYRLKQMGVDAYEVGNAVFIEEEHAKKVRDILNECSIEPWSAHGRYLDRECWPTLEGFTHDCRIAEIFGAKIIVTHSPGKLENGGFDYERYRSAADIAGEHGLIMAVETCHLGDGMPYSSITYRDLIEVVDTLGMPNVGINIDTGHVHAGERRDVETVIDEVGHRLKTLHLHDNFGSHDDHQAVGVGFINWEKVIASLSLSPYEGPLMLELSGIHKDRELVKQLNYDMNSYKEIAYSHAWLRFCWNENERQKEERK